MTEVTRAEATPPILARPFTLIRSQLGTITKIFYKKFLCNKRSLHHLHEAMIEKLELLHPQKADFQYLVSFDDHTHFEQIDIDELDRVSASNKKVTERIVLKWNVIHAIQDQPNELAIIVRVSNPINPMVYMQAVFSQSPDEIDRIEFESGSVSVSINGAGQILAEEVFALVSDWIAGCPRPEYVTTVHKRLRKHKKKISFLNFWLLPILVSTIFFAVLWRVDLGQLLIPILFVAIVSTYYLRNISTFINKKIDQWMRDTHAFSMFAITGGDSNQQNKYATRSQRSTIKLVAASILTFSLNVLAGVVSVYLMKDG